MPARIPRTRGETAAFAAFKKLREQHRRASELHDANKAALAAAAEEEGRAAPGWDYESKRNDRINAELDRTDSARALARKTLQLSAYRLPWKLPNRKRAADFLGGMHGFHTDDAKWSAGGQGITTGSLRWGVLGGELSLKLDKGGALEILKTDSHGRAHLITVAEKAGMLEISRTSQASQEGGQNRREISEFEERLKRHFRVPPYDGGMLRRVAGWIRGKAGPKGG
ncbi:MAG: hypothetical protein V1787_03770 [Candidatus Micrarchaeota archaeon]